MFGLSNNVRYFMCQHPVNMRKGIDSLFNLIISESPLAPMAGDVFVFFSKNRQSVKLLKCDNDGFLLYQKRLERGSFEMPRKNADTGYYELPDGRLAQRLSPRRKKSHWTELNKQRCQELESRGLMTPAGRTALDKAIS